MRRSLLLLATWVALGALPGSAAPLRLVRTILLPGVQGRIDHMAVDASNGRLFVAALGNNTLEVVDLGSGKHVRSLAGFHQPQGVAVVPALGLVLVANGEGGACDILDARSLKRLRTLKLSNDADNARSDALSGHVYVGYGDGALAEIDPGSGRLLREVRLQGHPESFQLENKGVRIFVNIPNSGHIAVVNRRTCKVIARWPLVAARANFPLALDEVHNRLFIGCRDPARLLVYDTRTGHAACPPLGIGEDADDVFCDANLGRVYVSCGQGVVDVFQRLGPNRYKEIARVATAEGARTSLWIPETHRLVVAAPRRGSRSAELLVYAAER